jgi:hypothetical protein
MLQTSDQTVSLYYQVCIAGSRVGIEAVYSEKGSLHYDERILANSFHSHRRHMLGLLRMFPVLRLSLLPLLTSQRR